MPEHATTPQAGTVKPTVYSNLGSSLYATTGSDPMTSCNWSAQVDSGANGPTSITVTCTYGAATPATSVTATIPWYTTPAVPLSSTSSGVTVDGTVWAAYGAGGTAIITFEGSVVQAGVVSIECPNGAVVAACIAS
jgi:hypothetical protein